MKLAFAIQRKLRLAIFMAVMMLFIILFTFIESYNVTRISRSFNSIYEDRLIPATDLYQISSQINDRNHQLLLFLFSGSVSAYKLQNNLTKTDKELDKLLSKYEKTYLIKAETDRLTSLKKKLDNFRRDEQLLFTIALHNKETARELYFSRTLPLFNELNSHLMELTKLQTLVGKELLKESLNIAHDSSLISTLQIIIGIILGLMILILITTSKEVIIRSNNFNMN